MTAEFEYSFCEVKSGLKIASNLMNRAVRVKQTVKDKVGRIFNAKVPSVKSVEPSVQNQVATNEEVKVGGIEHLIDLSDINISSINSKVDALTKQGKVEAKANRAVLFTSNLLNKIKKVALKWFGGNKETENVENVVATKVEEPVPALNTKTTVIPSTWATEDTLSQIENQTVPTFNPAIETGEKTNEETVAQNDIPVFPSIASFVPTEENSETKEKVENNDEISTSEEIKPEANMPEEPIIPTIIPAVENSTEKEDNKNEAEDTKKKVVVNTSEFVQEPTDLSTELQTQEQPTEVEETKMSAEDKITELLNRKVADNVGQNEEEKPNINQAYILAKLQRIGAEGKAKDAKLKTLGDKVSSLEEDNRDLKSKLGDSESQVKELTAKNVKLEEQVEKLTSTNASMENEHKSEIESLNVKIEEMSKARREEHEEAKRKEEKMQSDHSREIEELKQAHAEEIRRLNEANEKKIEAIYRTIANALGESVQEGKSL